MTNGSDNSMRPVSASPAVEDIERWLIDELAAELRLAAERIDVNQPIAAYGVDSMQVVTLLARLEDHLSVRFPSNPLEDHPTIAALAQFAVSVAATGGVR